MSLASRRADIASVMTASLADVDITIDPYRPNSPAPFRGWIEISQTDTEQATYAEVRISVEVLILVAVDRTDFEKAQDSLTVPLIAAVQAVSGRAPVVQPASLPVGQATLYALSVKFFTEATTQEEVA